MLKTFSKGGIHPSEHKLSKGERITQVPLPSVGYVLVAQHIGAPAAVLVKKNDEVKVGQLIAKSSGFVSANIHSPFSGKINKVDTIVDSSGYKKQCIVIDVEGDEWIESIDRGSEIKKEIILSKDEIIARIADAGIVGLGGATFPSHVKLAVPKGKTAEVLLINGVECEPYLTADHRLMLENAEEILIGIEILKKVLGVNRAIIGIENNKKDAVTHLSALAKQYNGISVCPLKVRYPQGGEKQLIEAVMHKEVSSGTLPIDVGAVVHNVGTAYAVYEAVQKNKPLFERIVTVTGLSVTKPGNYLTRVGTSIARLIEASGGLPHDTGKVISGGPMMGRALSSIDTPVTKGTSGVLIMPKEKAMRGAEENCIRCARCVGVCPMGLEPYLLMTLSQRAMNSEMKDNGVLDCIECGSCSYICPANRTLLDYIRLGKSTVLKIERARAQK